MTPDNDKNKTFAVQYLPKVTGLHKVRQFEDFVGRKTRTELKNVFVNVWWLQRQLCFTITPPPGIYICHPSILIVWSTNYEASHGSKTKNFILYFWDFVKFCPNKL